MDKESGEGNPFGAAPHERPVPRISIHAFCEFADTQEALAKAGDDRRLGKAQITVQAGGVNAAVEHYRGQVTPNLIIVETQLAGQDALHEIDRLAEVCDPSTKVVVIGHANDVELYRELMRRGASEYLVTPLNPLHVIEVISGLYCDPDAAPIGRVVSFVGARGGVGASTIAHNVGWCIAEGLNISATIVDFDLCFGTAALNFNEEASQGVAEALASPERLDDVLLDRLVTKRGDRLSLLTASATLERDPDAGVEAYETVIGVVRASTPCVIVDMPHVWTPWARSALVGSDEIVIVATPDLASLRNAKNLIENLKAARPNDQAPRLVLNQVGQPKRPEIPAKDFAETIGVEASAVLPYDPALFGAAANNGQMLMEVQPKSPSADGIRRLAEVATGRVVPIVNKQDIPILSMLMGKKRA